MSQIPAGPVGRSPADPDYVVAYLRDLDCRLRQLERNRTPEPVPMASVADAGHMAYAQDGHAAALDNDSGLYKPMPVLATLVFHQQGPATVKLSAPKQVRSPCWVTEVSAVLGELGAGTTEFQVLVNGVVVVDTAAWTPGMAPGTGATGLIVSDVSANPLSVGPLAPIADMVQVNVLSGGAGDAELVVDVGLSGTPRGL